MILMLNTLIWKLIDSWQQQKTMPENIQLNDIDSLVQDCSISIVNALKILQHYTKPSIYQISRVVRPWL